MNDEHAKFKNETVIASYQFQECFFIVTENRIYKVNMSTATVEEAKFIAKT